HVSLLGLVAGDGRLLAGDLLDRPQHVLERKPVPPPNVVDASRAAGVACPPGNGHDVVDVREVARLLAVAEEPDRRAVAGRGQERPPAPPLPGAAGSRGRCGPYRAGTPVPTTTGRRPARRDGRPVPHPRARLRGARPAVVPRGAGSGDGRGRRAGSAPSRRGGRNPRTHRFPSPRGRRQEGGRPGATR